MASLLLVDSFNRSKHDAATARREEVKIHSPLARGKSFPKPAPESKHQPQDAQKPQPKSSCKMMDSKMILNNGYFTAILPIARGVVEYRNVGVLGILHKN